MLGHCYQNERTRSWWLRESTLRLSQRGRRESPLWKMLQKNQIIAKKHNVSAQDTSSQKDKNVNWHHRRWKCRTWWWTTRKNKFTLSRKGSSQLPEHNHFGIDLSQAHCSTGHTIPACHLNGRGSHSSASLWQITVSDARRSLSQS